MVYERNAITSHVRPSQRRGADWMRRSIWRPLLRCVSLGHSSQRKFSLVFLPFFCQVFFSASKTKFRRHRTMEMIDYLIILASRVDFNGVILRKLLNFHHFGDCNFYVLFFTLLYFYFEIINELTREKRLITFFNTNLELRNIFIR